MVSQLLGFLRMISRHQRSGGGWMARDWVWCGVEGDGLGGLGGERLVDRGDGGGMMASGEMGVSELFGGAFG